MQLFLVQRRFSNPSGEREADFVPIVVWNKPAENSAKYLRKGSQCCVAGALQVRNYEAKDGSRRYITEIIADEVQFLSRSGEGNSAPSNTNNNTGNTNNNTITIDTTYPLIDYSAGTDVNTSNVSRDWINPRFISSDFRNI